MASLQAQGVHTLMPTFTDLLGAPKGKLVPVERLATMVKTGAGFAGPSIWGTGLPRYGPRSEYYARLQPDSLRPLPWLPGVAHGVCDGFAGGEPLDTCSRQVLVRQMARFAARGWTVWVGIEPEFFLLRQQERGARWQPADMRDDLAKPSYDLAAIDRRFHLLDELRQHLVALGFGVQQIDHEDANGQFEINYDHDTALMAADRYQLFKLVATAVAERHGLQFSTMPKPYADQPGSGLHFHISVTDADGRAVMADVNGVLGLSTEGQQMAAGLLAHADALSALCAPTVNSYRRLARGDSRSGTTWAPVWKRLGDNNRTCLLRAVDGRVEWRLPDPSCNVYLALAGCMAAMLQGVHDALPPSPPCHEDLYDSTRAGRVDAVDVLPRDLGSALAALRADAVLREAIGTAVCDQFLAIKVEEWADWQAACAQVTDWEHRRYGAAQ